jgi:hypothetical protein
VKGNMTEVGVTNNRIWPESLIDLLGEQHGIVDQLSELARRQASLIMEGRTDHLLGLLADRQQLIDRFTASQGLLAELTEGLEQRLQSVNSIQRDQIKSLIGAIGERLGEIMKRDEQDEATLRAGRDTVKQELASLSSGKQARNAYLAGPGAQTMFADRRG